MMTQKFKFLEREIELKFSEEPPMEILREEGWEATTRALLFFELRGEATGLPRSQYLEALADISHIFEVIPALPDVEPEEPEEPEEVEN